MLVLGAVVVATTGCAGEGGPGSTGEGAFATIQREIFNPSCTSASCHSSSFRAGNLSLQEGQSFDQLVGVAPDNPVALQQGLLRVTPQSLEESFLYSKITGNLLAGEGSPMPLASSMLSPDQIALIGDWILAGALPDDDPEEEAE